MLKLFSPESKQMLCVVLRYLQQNPGRISVLTDLISKGVNPMPRLAPVERKMLNSLMEALRTDTKSVEFARAAVRMGMMMERG